MAGERTRMAQAVLAVSVLAMAGCDAIGNPLEALGKRPPAPDEFSVVARAPLKMPGGRSLPEPRLGEASPLEPNPNRAAIQALMGDGATPQVSSTSSGEQALLSAANASASDTQIRAALAADLANGSADEPYEVPTIFELFDGKSSAPPKDAINAASEARRLQTEGIAAAPIDPTDVPEGKETGKQITGPVGLSYEDTTDRRPSNKLPSSTKPAFE